MGPGTSGGDREPMKRDARCTCRGMICGPSRRFTCISCWRSVPWCFGAADAHPNLCDDCTMGRQRVAQTADQTWTWFVRLWSELGWAMVPPCTCGGCFRCYLGIR
jgi:hypothetical protein